MKMDLVGLVIAGQSALIRVTGDDEPGYITVDITRNGVDIGASAVPGSGRRPVFAAKPPGLAVAVSSSPPWQAQDSVTFTLFDTATNTKQDQFSALVI